MAWKVPRLIRVAVVLASVAAAVQGPAFAAAIEGSLARGYDEPCKMERVPGLGRACRLGGGHYRVTLPDGFVLETHGPDPLEPADAAAPEDTVTPVAPACANPPHLHVLHGRPQGSGPDPAQVASGLVTIVGRMNAILQADALESGDVLASYRVKCDAWGGVEIGSFQGPETGGAPYTSDFDAIVGAARAAGYDRALTNYLIFYSGTSPGVCGVGNLAQDDRLSPDNRNLKGPNYGVVYEGCWDGRTPMHENGHNMGAVQRLAPMSDLAGHCLEGRDVMCYTSELLVLCEGRIRFDCGYDTYFDARPAEGSWLATHWNVGSRLNVFLAFSDTPAPPPPSEPSSGETSERPTQANQTSGQGNETASSGASNETQPREEPPTEPVTNETPAPDPVVAAADTPPPVEEPERPVPAFLAPWALGTLVAAAFARRRILR